MPSSLFTQFKSEDSIKKKLNLLFRNRIFRRFFIQFVFGIFLLLLFFYIVDKALNLELGFGHLNSRAGFGLSHTFIIDYNSNDSRWMSYFAGVINTIRVSLVGIVLATILGIFMGLARLSPNFLINKISTGYVEFIRNTPLLVQIIFWQLLLLQLPHISKALTFGGLSVWSNKGILLPIISSNENGSLWTLILFLGLIISLILRSRLFKYKEERVDLFSPNLISFFTFVAIAIISFFALSMKLSFNVPEVNVNQYGTYIQSGGFILTPQFAAVLFALVLYTGTFITEIVRGSIQSLPKGQTEAAMALGLNSYQRITLIILPQALRSIIPPLTNQYLNLTKNSSLSVAIAYPDLFMVSRTIMNNAGHALPMFVLILITYLTLSLVISLIMNIINLRVTRIGA